MKKLLNISIDDVSPHPLSSLKVLDNCYELIKKYPDIKFSLFVPISYWRTMKPNISTRSGLQIDLFPDFCKDLKNIPDANFEICYHGFYHGIPGKSDNDEFRDLKYDQAVKIFDAMFEVVNRAGLTGKFKKIFRPPAWRMSSDAIKAAIDKNIDILALIDLDYAKETYGGMDEKFKNIVYANVYPPNKELELFNKTEIVYHACEWDGNYFSKKRAKELELFIDKNISNIQFSFLQGLIDER